MPRRIMAGQGFAVGRKPPDNPCFLPIPRIFPLTITKKGQGVPWPFGESLWSRASEHDGQHGLHGLGHVVGRVPVDGLGAVGGGAPVDSAQGLAREQHAIA